MFRQHAYIRPSSKGARQIEGDWDRKATHEDKGARARVKYRVDEQLNVEGSNRHQVYHVEHIHHETQPAPQIAHTQ